MNDEWETPDDLFTVLNEEFNFDWDAAASRSNTKVRPYVAFDSLNVHWVAQGSRIWLNPPYSRGNIDAFMQKVCLHRLDLVIVALVRFDPSAKWFQNFVDGQAHEVRMLARRVKFKGAASAYNFPTCIVVYDPRRGPLPEGRTAYFIWDWRV